MEIIIEEGEAAERPSEARAGHQEVEQQPDVLVVDEECVEISVSGAEVVLSVV